MREAVDSGERERASDTVGIDANVCLELAQRTFGMGSEDAVNTTAGEPERVEGMLELAHVSTVEIRQTQEQRAIAQRECRVYEGRPALIVNEI